MDSAGSMADAVATKDGKVIAVGTNQEIDSLGNSYTQGIDLQGRTVVPGLADIHVHLASDAGQGEAVEVRDFFDPGIHSSADIQARLSDRAASTPPGQWIVLRGSPMQDFRLAERRFPTKEELDAAAPRNPCYATFGAHVIVANSLALKAKNVTRDTPSPQGGTVVKDPVSGEPTGVLRERAQYLIKSREADRGLEALEEGILLDLQRASARGITTVHDIVVNRDEVRAYQNLARAGRLPVRVQLIVRVIESRFSKESLLDLGFVQGFGSDWLKLGGVKMSIDGGFTGKNAAFSEPLSFHGQENPGLIRIKQDELDETVWRYHELGMRCCVHAIGDVALDMILEAYEKALARLPRQDHRHRIEHFGNFMVTPERIARAKRLGLLAIPNPSIFYFLGKEVQDTLGPLRSADAFPIRRLLDAGFPIAFGSDAPGYWPVDSLRDIGVCVARTAVDGVQIAPDQAITVEEGLRAQTVTAAWVGFQEDKLGSIEPGKLADLAVLGADPFTFPAERFRELPVDVTIAGGKVMSGSPAGQSVAVGV